jgi:hypothetical protein
VDIGLDALHRIVFGCRHLLHRSRVDDVVDAVESLAQPLRVTHVADEIAQLFLIILALHLKLLELIAREDNELLHLVTGQKLLGTFAAEGAGTASDQDRFVVEHGGSSL